MRYLNLINLIGFALLVPGLTACAPNLTAVNEVSSVTYNNYTEAQYRAEKYLTSDIKNQCMTEIKRIDKEIEVLDKFRFDYRTAYFMHFRLGEKTAIPLVGHSGDKLENLKKEVIENQRTTAFLHNECIKTNVFGVKSNIGCGCFYKITNQGLTFRQVLGVLEPIPVY
ncbi:MAG: hypothetical protein HC850_12350 [Rhodomicrobium sp.]|nr:hypothetical protein [Rhodomicrobium sp.]